MRRPLSVSSQLWMFFIAGTIALLLVIFLGISGGFKKHFANQVEPHIDHYMHYVITDIGTPPNYQRAQTLATKLNAVIKIASPDSMWSSDGNLGLPRWLRDDHRRHGPFRFLKITQHGYTFFFLPKLPHDHANDYDDQPFFWLLLLLVVLILWALYAFISRQFRPIQHEIKTGLAAISQGDLSHRISVSRTDEIGQLADDINAMAAQLETLLQSRQDLLLAVSHELRSPLTRSKLSLAMLEDSNLRQSLQEDLDELEQTINTILDAERLHSDHALLHCTPTDIPKLVQQVITQYFPKQAITQTVPTSMPQISIDSKRTALLLKNLLENAIRHNRPEHGPVQLSVDYQTSRLQFLIKDHGEGIAAEHLDKLTRAFYRPDKSRARNTGGLGLGLYLCDGIAKAHAGSLRIESTVVKGTTFHVILHECDA